MMRAFRKLYQAILPGAVRRSRPVRMVKGWLVLLLGKLLKHDQIYTDAYYQHEVEPSAAQAAPVIAASLCRDLAPARVSDIGCGTGALLAALKAQGCAVFGVDQAAAALARALGFQAAANG